VATHGGTAAGPGGVAVGGNMIGDILLGTAAPPLPAQGLRQAYLTWVMQEARNVPLTGVSPWEAMQTVCQLIMF